MALHFVLLLLFAVSVVAADEGECGVNSISLLFAVCAFSAAKFSLEIMCFPLFKVMLPF